MDEWSSNYRFIFEDGHEHCPGLKAFGPICYVSKLNVTKNQWFLVIGRCDIGQTDES
jgi:hypothetical protein